MSENLTKGSESKKKSFENIVIGKAGEVSNKNDEPQPDKIGKSVGAKEVEQMLQDNVPEVSLESGSVKVSMKKRNSDVIYIGAFEDMFDQDLVLTLNKGVFKEDEEVEATVILEYSGKNVKLDLAGVIVEVEDLDETQEMLMINVPNLTPESLDQFMDLYRQRQENIVEFMSLAKGY